MSEPKYKMDARLSFCVDGTMIHVNTGEYTSGALALAITKAFHDKGIFTESECHYDATTDSFKWRRISCPK